MSILSLQGISEEILNDIRLKVAEWETKFNVRCAAIYSPYRIGFGVNIVSLSLLVFPLEGESDSHPNFGWRVKECWQEMHNQLLHKSGGWFCHVAQGLVDFRPWFSRFTDQPDRFPLADAAAGSDLISPVIYGEAIIANARAQAEDFFGRGIIDHWANVVVPRELARRADRFEKRQREFIRYCRERRTLLNHHELEELKALLEKLKEHVAEGTVSCVVALDGSGRPLGKAIKWFFGSSFPVMHLSPHGLRKVNFDDRLMVEVATNALKTELPALHALWSSDPTKVVFVDDQIGYGHTAEALSKFTRHLSGQETKLRMLVLSAFEGSNAPSWLRKRQVQGIAIKRHSTVTFLVEEKATKQSIRFYQRLRQHVLAWKRKP
jgi:adenine/guanine phosphoribosyltransferase-like PRPP-binding protein